MAALMAAAMQPRSQQQHQLGSPLRATKLPRQPRKRTMAQGGAGGPWGEAGPIMDGVGGPASTRVCPEELDAHGRPYRWGGRMPRRIEPCRYCFLQLTCP